MTHTFGTFVKMDDDALLDTDGSIVVEEAVVAGFKLRGMLDMVLLNIKGGVLPAAEDRKDADPTPFTGNILLTPVHAGYIMEAVFSAMDDMPREAFDEFLNGASLYRQERSSDAERQDHTAGK